MLRSKDTWIVLIIYLCALALTLWHGLTQSISSDQLQEYSIFLKEVKSGYWSLIPDNIVNSCLTVTLIPALISKGLHLPAETVFRIFPCLLQSLMPVFSYLIVRRYYDRKWALAAPSLVLASYYFSYSSTMGRVGVAWAFLTILIWAALNKRWFWVLITGALLSVSHYGTVAVGLVMLVVLLGSSFIWEGILSQKDKIKLGVSLGILLVGAVIWNYFIADSAGRYVLGFIKNFLGVGSTTGLPNLLPEPALRAALGVGLSQTTIPQRIEFISSWTIIAVIVFGFLVSLKRSSFDRNYTVLGTFMFTLVGMALISPFISTYYGAERLYFTGIPLYAGYFIQLPYTVFKKHKIVGYILTYSLLLVYGLSVSGVIHRLFEIIK